MYHITFIQISHTFWTEDVFHNFTGKVLDTKAWYILLQLMLRLQRNLFFFILLFISIYILFTTWTVIWHSFKTFCIWLKIKMIEESFLISLHSPVQIDTFAPKYTGKNWFSATYHKITRKTQHKANIYPHRGEWSSVIKWTSAKFMV